MAGALDGVRVIDLTTVVMGPYATQILGDFGADVIKVEPLEGDVMRSAWPQRNPGMGHVFLNVNRNKRSLALDLKNPAAHAALLELLRTADVLVYNIRPAAMTRLKLGYEALQALNPRLLYVGGFGYSQRGPYAARPAYDDLIQGAIGVPWLHQAAGNAGPRYAPLILADRTTGLQICNAVCAALFARERSGRGQRIDVPMFEGLLQTVLGEHLGGLTYDPPEGPPGYVRLLAKDRRPYETGDGHVCALIYNDKQWAAFLKLLDREDLLEDPRYATHAGRAQNYDAAYAFVAEEMRKRTTGAWIDALEAVDIPVQRMNSIEDIVADPHLAATGYFEMIDHPSEGRIRSMRVPSEWSGTAPGYRRHAPRLGEHTRELLGEAGLDAAAIDALIAAGAAKAA
ncbi:MAG: CoA transferase [Proteobacteria bacterium]|nr:CoA transferase [Pseudomonadota bacterium]